MAFKSATSPEFIPNMQSYTNFKYFWYGQLISLLGSSVVQFSIIWWVTITTLDPILVGLTFLFGLGTTILVSPVAGVVTDRFQRRLILFLIDFLQVFVTIILFYLFFTDIVTVTYVFIILGLRGVFQGFHQLAFNTSIPTMVPEEKLQNFNALTFLGSGSMEMIGPVLGAILITFFGLESIENIFLIDGITFIFALIPIILIEFPDVRKAEEEKNLSNDFVVGIKFIRSNTGLLTLLVIFSLLNFLFGSLYVIIPLAVADPHLLDEGELVLGITMAVMQLGIILFATILAVKSVFSSNISAIYFGLIISIFPLLGVVYACQSQNVLLLYISAFVLGVGTVITNSHSQTIWHKIVPKDLQGRVFSVRSTIALSFLPLAMLTTGYLIEILGIYLLLYLSFLLQLSVILYSWFFTSVRHIEQVFTEE